MAFANHHRCRNRNRYRGFVNVIFRRMSYTHTMIRPLKFYARARKRPIAQGDFCLYIYTTKS